MAPKSAPPPYGSTLQPLYATYPNETRLQELLDLQRRRQGQAPAPNAYNVSLRTMCGADVHQLGWCIALMSAAVPCQINKQVSSWASLPHS